MNHDLPKLFSEGDAARYLDVSLITLRRWRLGGKIGCVMVGKSPKYTEQQILDFVAVNTVPPRPTDEAKPKPRRKPQSSTMSVLAQAHAILSATRKQ